jgi:hypothetical protein
MSEAIVNLEAIKAQAREAAGKFTNVNDACPYPFGTAAGQAFKEEFNWVRSVIEQKSSTVQGAGQ